MEIDWYGKVGQWFLSPLKFSTWEEFIKYKESQSFYETSSTDIEVKRSFFD